MLIAERPIATANVANSGFARAQMNLLCVASDCRAKRDAP